MQIEITNKQSAPAALEPVVKQYFSRFTEYQVDPGLQIDIDFLGQNVALQVEGYKGKTLLLKFLGGKPK